jgi:hypothetical protein
VSDTIGADLLVLGVACGAALVLGWLGRSTEVVPTDRTGAVLRSLLVAPIALVAAVGLGAGALLGAYSWHQHVEPGVAPASALHHAYLAAQAVSVGASAAAIVLLLALLHHTSLDR